MALENIVIGSELSPQDFVFNEATQMFELNLADGMARNPSGVWGINAATLEAMITAAVNAAGGHPPAPRVRLRPPDWRHPGPEAVTEAVLDGVVTGRNVGPGLCLAVQRDEPDHVVVVANLGPELYFDPQGRIRVAFRPRWRWLDVCLVCVVVAVTLFAGWAIGWPPGGSRTASRGCTTQTTLRRLNGPFRSTKRRRQSRTVNVRQH
jgi:hypothetical protein